MRALPFGGIELHFELLDLLRAHLACFEQVLGVLALPLRARHFVARRVLLALQPFDGWDQPAPVGLGRGQLLQLGGHIEAAARHALLDGLEVVANEPWIKHVWTILLE